MTTTETAKLTGIPEWLLIRMRARETRTLKGGPPYCKKIRKNGAVVYTYSMKEVARWMRIRNCALTAGDAAAILGMSRDELLSKHRSQKIGIKTKDYQGSLFIDNGHGIYIWIPLQKKKKAA